jgi:hypothetical protein
MPLDINLTHRGFILANRFLDLGRTMAGCPGQGEVQRWRLDSRCITNLIGCYLLASSCIVHVFFFCCFLFFSICFMDVIFGHYAIQQLLKQLIKLFFHCPWFWCHFFLVNLLLPCWFKNGEIGNKINIFCSILMLFTCDCWWQRVIILYFINDYQALCF